MYRDHNLSFFCFTTGEWEKGLKTKFRVRRIKKGGSKLNSAEANLKNSASKKKRLRRTKQPAALFFPLRPEKLRAQNRVLSVVLRATRPFVTVAENGYFDQNVAPAQQRNG